MNNRPLNFTDPTGLRPIQDDPDKLSQKVVFESDQDDADFYVTRERDLNYEFSTELRNSRGASYSHTRLPTSTEMDCSGTIVYSLTQMGYDVPSELKVADMVSGDIPWIKKFPNVQENRQGSAGVLNFYKFDGKKYVHVNAGVGQRGDESGPQVIDATESNWMTVRNTNPKQIFPAESGSVNQTFVPFTTTYSPELQAEILWDLLPRND